MTRAFSFAFLLSVFLLLPVAAQADPIYDFSTKSVGNVITSLGSSTTLSGAFGDITAFAYYLNGTTWTASELIARNETNDNGLGVCSEGILTNCNVGFTGDGDDNELSQLAFNEAIVLQRPADTVWTGLWLSSLDNGGTNNTEKGKLYWGNNLATLFAGTPFLFDYPEFLGTAVEGKLTLPVEFDPSALYVLFVPGGTVGQNNDYLVWGADLQEVPEQVVPEPASFLLVGSGLLAVAHGRRRSRRSAEGRS